jgi:hypothetical protein
MYMCKNKPGQSLAIKKDFSSSYHFKNRLQYDHQVQTVTPTSDVNSSSNFPTEHFSECRILQTIAILRAVSFTACGKIQVSLLNSVLCLAPNPN